MTESPSQFVQLKVLDNLSGVTPTELVLVSDLTIDTDSIGTI